MQQVGLFINGETDYFKLVGDTGPLVYPALHTYLYSGLYFLTEHGTNIFQAQCIFAALYLVTVAIVLACYRRVGAPPWLLVTLVLSKRLHSIFLLRLFNDAWAALTFWAAIYLFQRKIYSAGAFVWSCGLGIKLTMLLPGPAVGAIVLQAIGTSEGFFIGMFCAILQMISSFPFIFNGEGYRYMTRAYDFGRQFLFKWTVNWRFLGKDVFSSQTFQTSLLVTHASLLLAFFETRWIKPSSNRIPEFVYKYSRTMDFKSEQEYSKRVTSTFVMETMLGCMAIGLLCARSLHYQFYAYLGWASPFMLWRSGLHPALVLAALGVQEWAWLQYPSMQISSIVVVGELALQVAALWYGSAHQPDVEVDAIKAEATEAAKAHAE